ncbi:hypothetical protein Ae201684_002831 [Aphanomyces euteiches]|nr:hypothetical protein Ae201684_002831 [Aphanomyces euteiches]
MSAVPSKNRYSLGSISFFASSTTDKAVMTLAGPVSIEASTMESTVDYTLPEKEHTNYISLEKAAPQPKSSPPASLKYVHLPMRYGHSYGATLPSWHAAKQDRLVKRAAST